MAKRGYNRDTIRGGASDWDVSRPFSSYLRLLAQLLVHPIRFFELLPRVPDLRAPGLFLAFSGLLSAPVWLVFEGLIPALVVLAIPLPLSFAVAGLCFLGTIGGRYGYRVTWRIVVYPLGFSLPFVSVPGLRWVAALYAGLALLPIGLATVREVGPVRAALAPVVVTGLLVLALWRLV